MNADTGMKSIVRKKKITALLLFLLLCTLTGCIPNNFTREEKKAFLREAREVASDSLSDWYSWSEIRKIEPETEVEEDGYVLTEFASGQFVWKWQTYDFAVNVETGEVYTSVLLDELRERLKEEVLRGMGVNGEEASVESCELYCLMTDDGEAGRWFQNVVPQEASVEELVEKILQDTDRYQFSIWLQYKGEDLPLEMMEMEAPFPTLNTVGIYHVADEHALYEGEYGYSTLPSLSKEILILEFYSDTANYIGYQTLEQDGLRLVYKAYERTREQDAVTESVINREDITLTVTDEYIRVDCAKEDYSIYLSTADPKIARKYRYVNLSNRVITEKETDRGKWYSFEDGYVFSESVYIEAPYEIHPFYMKGNIIYSRPQKR
ncbi:MAG: hypothetical protein NC543_07835 [bacterium]|nr:hypothetical protein [bacterium]MCM1373488.1 hypothetical protein [Muribaculum sp.]